MEWSSDGSQVARGRVRSRSAEGRRLGTVATLIDREAAVIGERESLSRQAENTDWLAAMLSYSCLSAQAQPPLPATYYTAAMHWEYTEGIVLTYHPLAHRYALCLAVGNQWTPRCYRDSQTSHADCALHRSASSPCRPSWLWSSEPEVADICILEGVRRGKFS